jgi:hypothetical protein
MNTKIPSDNSLPPSTPKSNLEIVGDCLCFYLMNLLRCVDVILNEIGKGGFGSVCVLTKKRMINKFS